MLEHASGTSLVAAEKVVHELPVPAVFFGLGAFALLVVLLLITYSFNKR